MAYIQIQEQLDFDLAKAVQCLKSYSNSTEIDSFIIDHHGNLLYNNGCNGCCEFCQNIQADHELQQACRNAYLYGGYQAERFGGKYIFFCPMGLVYWASPIVKNGTMAGAVLSGPVLMMQPDEFLLDDIIRKSKINDDQFQRLKEHFQTIPIVKPDRVGSLADLLLMVGSYISDLNASQYTEEKVKVEQQSDISTYLHYIKTMGGDENSLQSYPLDKEKELLSLISLGDKAGSQKVLNEIFGHIFFSTGGNFELIKARVLELIVLLSRAALEGGADVEQIFGLNYRYLNEIHGFKSVDELTYWLSKIMTRFTDCVFNLTDVKHVDVIYKAIDFIKKHYSTKITLEDVASYVYLSPSYFSKVFKDEMKSNFSTYLNTIRIEMSKKILLNDSIPLLDVSDLVGYEDQSYFSKVFKKIVGISPGKYRELKGLVKSGAIVQQKSLF